MENEMEGLKLDGKEEVMLLHYDKRSLFSDNEEEMRYLFKFFYKMDIERVINEALWTFNNHLLIMHRLEENKDLMQMSLIFSSFWVQVHDLPPRFFSENVMKQLGNFIGRFLEYDMKQLSRGMKNYLRVRVQLDVRCPLKRRKKIMISPRKCTYDLSLKAQPMRVAAMNSVWLREEGDWEL
ncbi:hypothetical protein Gohar_010417 [Gossypium harknessii]|uniref:DUF4283 domain-containing protein n=1 Tax=Gossypium harknessii TaxID=34285 RepID=A0A7J9GQU1_9ROSI|nr:hypothetical protein [Gossypium harknessii]